MDYDGIAVSGAPTFEETGNTAQISGDSYTVDNVATYHEKDIAFCDLEKNCINKQKRMIAVNYYRKFPIIIDSNGEPLQYLVREIACTHERYEPRDEYADAGGTITNRPAAVDFTVQKMKVPKAMRQRSRLTAGTQNPVVPRVELWENIPWLRSSTGKILSFRPGFPLMLLCGCA